VKSPKFKPPVTPKKKKRSYTNDQLCSTSLIIRDVQVKTTIRYYLTPVRITMIKITTTTNTGKNAEKKRSPAYC
jgi:hypothetical protein